MFLGQIITNTSCSRNVPNNEMFKDIMQRNDIETKLVYVLPTYGCGGCISEVEKLANDKLNNDTIFFIFTRINSLKRFKNEFRELISADNVIIDSNSLFAFDHLDYNIYPLLYELTNREVKFLKYIKP